MTSTDRYLRTGTPVPEIYPGTVTFFSQAEKDTLNASSRMAGQHCLFAIRDGQWQPVRVYVSGECTWSPGQ